MAEEESGRCAFEEVPLFELSRKEHLEQLERNKEELLEYYAAMAPTSLAELSGEERRRVYETLRLCVRAHSDGALEVTGAFGKELCRDEHGLRRG